PLLHLPPITPRRRLGCGPAVFGWHERTHATAFTGITVVGLRIVPGVGEHAAWLHVRHGCFQQWDEAIDIRTRPSTRQHRDEQMGATVDGSFELGEPAIRQGLPAFGGSVATAHEVGAAVAEIEARGIERDPRDAPAAAEETAYRMSQQPTDTGHGEQALAGFLQGGEVRYGLQL